MELENQPLNILKIQAWMPRASWYWTLTVNPSGMFDDFQLHRMMLQSLVIFRS